MTEKTSSNRCHQPGWDRIGRMDSSERRSLWLRTTGAGDDTIAELCAGREGDDFYVRLTPADTQWAALLHLLLAARAAAVFESPDYNALDRESLQGALRTVVREEIAASVSPERYLETVQKLGDAGAVSYVRTIVREELAASDRRISGLDTLLDRARRLAQTRLDDVVSVMKERDHFRAENAAVTARVDAMTTRADGLECELDALREVLEPCSVEREQFRRQLAQTDALLKANVAKLREANSDLADAVIERDKARAHCHELGNEFTRVVREREEYRVQLREVNAKLTAAVSERDNCRSEIDGIKREPFKFVAGLGYHLGSSSITVETTADSGDAQRIRIRDLERELSAFKTRSDEFRASVAKVTPPPWTPRILSESDIDLLKWLSDSSTMLPGAREARIVLDGVISEQRRCRSSGVVVVSLDSREEFIAQVKPSEAVHGFALWLATCRELETLPGSEPRSTLANLGSEFCHANGFTGPRAGWAGVLIKPRRAVPVIPEGPVHLSHPSPLTRPAAPAAPPVQMFTGGQAMAAALSVLETLSPLNVPSDLGEAAMDAAEVSLATGMSLGSFNIQPLPPGIALRISLRPHPFIAQKGWPERCRRCGGPRHGADHSIRISDATTAANNTSAVTSEVADNETRPDATGWPLSADGHSPAPGSGVSAMIGSDGALRSWWKDRR